MDLRRLLTIGSMSVALYAAVHFLQRVIAFGELSIWPMALYVAATIVTFLLYGKVVTAAAAGTFQGTKTRVAALLIPAAISLALIPVRPSLSIDVFSYLGHAYQVRIGENPYAQPVKDLRHTAYGDELMRRGWHPVHDVSPYGPLWTRFEAAVGTISDEIDVQVWVTKATVVGFSLLCGLMIWTILGRVSRRDQLTGTVLYLWNPVVVMEFAGEGHNDSIVLAAMLVSLLLAVRLHAGASMIALGIGALVKITGLVILPAQLAFWWRTAGPWRLAAAGAAAGVVIAALALLLYAPFWIGMATLDGVRAHGQPSLLPSTQGVLYSYLTRSHSERASAQVLTIVMTGGLAGYAMLTSLKAVDPQSMFRACGRIAFAYLLLAPGYWPWYAALPVTLMALAPRGLFIWAIMVISLASRFAAPIDRLRINGLMEWPTQVWVATVVGLWAPAIVLLVLAVWHVRVRSRARTHGTPTLGRSEG